MNLVHSFGGCPCLSPRGAMLQHPVKKRPFKSDVATMLLTLDPLVTQNFIPFRQELTVERRVLQKITGIHGCMGTRHLEKSLTHLLTQVNPREKRQAATGI